MPSKRTLLIASTASLGDILRKGNVWYVRHYEAYFDMVYVVFVFGAPHKQVIRGNTWLVSLAEYGSGKLNIILAPIRIFRFARRIKPTVYETGDLVYSWWTNCLLKLLMRAEIYLIPVCIPELIYENTNKSMSGLLPIWVERIFTRFAFAFADKVVLPSHESAGSFYDSILSYPSARKKAVVVDQIVDDMPSTEFFESLAKIRQRPSGARGRRTNLVYVGRLDREKLVEDLIRMMASIKALSGARLSVKLNIIGDGPERVRLEDLSERLGVRKVVRFVGTVPSSELPEHLLKSDIFVSPFTGTSLREASLCGLAIVAYEMEWVHGVFNHEETALLVRPRDFDGMAKQVIRLVNDRELRRKLSRNVRKMAWTFWSPQTLEASLRRTFGGVR